MKKNMLIVFILTTLCACNGIFAGNNHFYFQQNARQETQDTSEHHHKHKEKHHPHVGGTTWKIDIFVGDLKGTPISGATVTAPCTGWPAKTTDATGRVEFSGMSTCPCYQSPASITTSKGCNVKISVSCDSTYTVACP